MQKFFYKTSSACIQCKNTVDNNIVVWIWRSRWRFPLDVQVCRYLCLHFGLRFHIRAAQLGGRHWKNEMKNNNTCWQSINLEKSVGDMLALKLSPSMWSVWSGDWSNYQVLTSVHNSHRFGSSLRIHLSRLLYPKRGQSVKRHKRHASFKTVILKFTSLEENCLCKTWSLLLSSEKN